MTLQTTKYHIPVLLNTCIDALQINPNGIYVDITFGGGGHSKAIYDKLTNGKLIAFDRDADALTNAWDNEKFTLVNQNYAQLKNWLNFYGISQIDGLLGDLGVSSHQFDISERGFSFRFDGPLDMRMNQQSSITAATILNEYETSELKRIFYTYGEINNTNRLVEKINQYRQNKKFETIDELVSLAKALTIKPKESQYLAQVFQALRIEVNDELKAIETMLEQALTLLKPGGRLVIMSYHSLEDRIIKNFMRSGNIKGEVAQDFYGHFSTPFKLITRKPIEPSKEEVNSNSRARSAKLRIAEKIGN